MILNELSAVASEKFPVRALSDHLRMGTGFADDGSQDAILEGFLRGAVAAVEARTGKALFQRRFSWVIYNWISSAEQGLPVSPIQSIESMRMTLAAGVVEDVSPNAYRLKKDAHFPMIVSTSSSLPRIPIGGEVELIVEAGFGPDWSDLPPDLQQAVLMLAADYYESRHGDLSAHHEIPFGVLSLLEPYRKMRMSGGPK